MPTREQKETTIQELEGIFERAQVAIVTDYRGLTVKEITDLRRRLQKVGGELTVAKNTLIDRVTRGNDSWKAIEPLLAGPTALAIGFEDPVAAAKVVSDFAKEKRKVEIKAIEPVGHYAIRPLFSDGHDSGIYSWDLLHSFCLNQQGMWEDYLRKLEAAGYTRESGRDIVSGSAQAHGCAG